MRRLEFIVSLLQLAVLLPQFTDGEILGLLQTSTEGPHHLIGQAGLTAQQAIQVVAGHLQDLDRGAGAHTGGVVVVLAEEAHFAQECADAAICQQPLVRRAQRFDDFDFALDHNVETAAGLPFAHQQRSSRKLTLLQIGSQVGQSILRQGGK